MKVYLISFIFILFFSKVFSQTIVKTYYDPFTKTQLKEVYTVISGTPTPNGLYKSYDEGGKLAAVGDFLKGVKNGIWKEYEDGILSTITTYKKGKKDGLLTIYDNSSGKNRITSIAIFKDDYNLKTTRFEWYPNGVKNEEYEVYWTGMGEGRNGIYLSYWDNGVIQETGNYNHQNKIGIWKNFRKNGIINDISVYDSVGKPISSKGYYLNGKLHYQVTLDAPNIKSQIEFDSLKSTKIALSIFEYLNEDCSVLKSKKISYYDPLGNSIQVVKTFSDKGREGTWKEYMDKDWNEIYDTAHAVFYRIITYQSDQIIGKVLDYYKKGSIQGESELQSDSPDVLKPNGHMTTYYPNGKIEYNCEYDNLGFIQTALCYNDQGKITKSLKKQSEETSAISFSITWYDINGKPLSTKEIKILPEDKSKGYDQLNEFFKNENVK
jgi:antitoxin component YwqK of YwqJK toxin-antitoxin module